MTSNPPLEPITGCLLKNDSISVNGSAASRYAVNENLSDLNPGCNQI